MAQFKEILSEKTTAAEAVVMRFLPEEEGPQKTIFSAMNYSMKAGGKRLRPMLMHETFRLFEGRREPLVEPMMAAIEMIHTYSLIHDDLPALDNDDYRRGRLTSHKVYGEAMAILAGDALQSFAYETAARVFDMAEDPEEMRHVARAMQLLTVKPGVNGMIGGQVVDVELTGKAVPEDLLHFIFDLKTGALIEASMMIGACLAGVDDQMLKTVETAAHKIGMAFQIRDDILDVTGDEAALGKPVHSDEKNEKTTWVSLYGLEKAQADVAMYTDEAIGLLRQIAPAADAEDTFLFDLIRYLAGRMN